MKKILPILLIISSMFSCIFYSTPPLGETNFPLKQTFAIPINEDIQQIAVADTWIAVCTLNNIIAIDINTQKELWKIDFKIINDEKACTFANDLLIATSYNQIIVINKFGEKKKINLALDLDNESINRIVAVYPNYLYIIIVPSWRFEVYDISKNTLLWKMSAERGNTNVFFEKLNNIVYITTSNSIGVFDNLSGELLWIYTGRNVSDSTFDAGILYVYEEIKGNDNYYRFSAIEVESQKVLWSKDAFFSPASGVNKLTIIDNLLIASAGDLIAIDKYSGEQIWRTSLGESVYTNPIEFDDVIYVKGYASRTVFAISSTDGTIIGSANLDFEDDGPFKFADVITSVYEIEDGIVFNTINKVMVYKIK